MIQPAAALAPLLLLAATPAPTAQPAWILTCDVVSVSGQKADSRVFRIAPQLLQEWRAAEQRFGPNLCASFSCSAGPNKLEGVISSATLVVTVRLDPTTGKASWRTVGASGGARTSGSCVAKVETAATGTPS